MDGLTPTVWFPVVTLIGGALLKAAFDALTENRKAEIDKAVRIEKRKEMLLMQRIDLQRKALGDLQFAISDLMRCAAQINIADAESLRASGNWGEAALPAELNEKFRATSREVTLIKVRVREERVRNMVSDISSACSGVTLATTSAESERQLRTAAQLFQEFNEKVGETLRALEDEELAIFA